MYTALFSNIPTTTSPEKVREFIGLCGKTVVLEPVTSMSYKVVFSDYEALVTALLLDGAILDGNSISVSSPDATLNVELKVESKVDSNVPRSLTASLDHSKNTAVTSVSKVDAKNSSSSSSSSLSSLEKDFTKDIDQEHKPKTAIFAEYLSRGYVLGDQVLQKAVQYDSKRGYSSKFKAFLSNLDSKYHVQEKFTQEKSRAMTSAENAHLGEKRSQVDLTVGKYFNKAKSTAYGSKLHDFYLKGVSDVKDIHQEATRLAQIKLSKTHLPSSSPSHSSSPSPPS